MWLQCLLHIYVWNDLGLFELRGGLQLGAPNISMNYICVCVVAAWRWRSVQYNSRNIINMVSTLITPFINRSPMNYMDHNLCLAFRHFNLTRECNLRRPGVGIDVWK